MIMLTLSQRWRCCFFGFGPESTSESVEFYWKFRDSMMSLRLYTDLKGDEVKKNGTRDSVHLTFLPLENDHSNIGSNMEMLFFEFRPESTSESIEF